jgi:hypothetical protein
MTIERDNDAMDELVSNSYRQHSTEQVPDALNKRVLKMAADETRSNGALAKFFDTWTKPLAWAATIGLSLAIVIEISQVENGPLPAASTAPESVEDQFRLEDTSQFDDARNQARLRAGPSNVDIDLAKVDRMAIPEQIVPEEDLKASSSDLSDTPAAPAAPAAEQPIVAARALPSAALKAENKAASDSAACDEVSRKTASNWLACIEELRLAGAVEDADREYGEFVLRFRKE